MSDHWGWSHGSSLGHKMKLKVLMSETFSKTCFSNTFSTKVKSSSFMCQVLSRCRWSRLSTTLCLLMLKVIFYPLPLPFVTVVIYFHKLIKTTHCFPNFSCHQCSVSVKFSTPSFFIMYPRNFSYIFLILNISFLVIPVFLKTSLLLTYSVCSIFSIHW